MKKIVSTPVSCPCCNKRLFDVDISTEGKVQIKCNICRSIVNVYVHKMVIHTEQIGA